MSEKQEQLRDILDAVFTAGGASVQYGWDVDKQMRCIEGYAERIRRLFSEQQSVERGA